MRGVAPELDYAPSLTAAVTGAELVCLLTEWDEFRHADPHTLAGHVAARRILDGRNSLDPVEWERAGWRYRGIGRHRPGESHHTGQP